MAVTLKHKVSTAAGVAPAAANLSPGEIGVNTADGRAFVRKGAGVATLPNVDDNNGRYVRHDAAQSLTTAQQGNAQANLGGTTVGRLLFTAADAASARTAIDLPAGIAALGYNTVGSHVFACTSAGSSGPGQTIAGSSLRPVGFTGTDTTNAVLRILNGWPGMSGTWRSCGFCDGQPGVKEGATLWQRIA